MQKTYFIQMVDGGWSLHRVAGITTKFTTLRAARMIVEDENTKLICLDKEGNRLH